MGSTSSEAEGLRSAFEKAREGGSAAEAREAAVAYYWHRAKEGGTQEQVARELGVNRWTLARWHQKGLERGSPAATSSKSVAVEESDEELAGLRLAVAALGPRSPSRRFPEELKTRIVAWAEGRRERGVAAGHLADALGVPWESLSKWLGRPARASGPRKLRPVEVVSAAVARPILKTPSGYVIEGLDVEALAQLLRRLG